MTAISNSCAGQLRRPRARKLSLECPPIPLLTGGNGLNHELSCAGLPNERGVSYLQTASTASWVKPEEKKANLSTHLPKNL